MAYVLTTLHNKICNKKLKVSTKASYHFYLWISICSVLFTFWNQHYNFNWFLLKAAFERRRGNVESICRELMMDDSSCLASPKTSKRPRQKKKKSKTASSDVIACDQLESEPSKKVVETCHVSNHYCMFPCLSKLHDVVG